MAARLKIVRVPKTPATAYNQDRDVTDLVRTQVRHAYKELHDWWQKVGSIEPSQIQTEQQAAEYVRTVTRILHPQGAHTSQIPQSPAPKSGVWLVDPADASKLRRGKRRLRTTRRVRR